MDTARLSIPHLLAIAASLLVLGCTPPSNEQPPQRSPAGAEGASAPESLPTPEAPLDREGMILAALKSATAAALGQDDASAQAELKGRRFEVRIRFGCSGDDDTASSGWKYDAVAGALRLRVRADLINTLTASDLADGTIEGALGFTIRRPWMLVDGCPDPQFSAMSDGPAFTITQLFSTEDSRVERPKAFYEAVVQMAPEELPTKGLNLILSGRLKPLASGRTIRCVALDSQPACMISTVIDRVRIEDPVRDVTLADFGGA